METLNPRAGFLSNYEVLHHLLSQSSSRSQQLKQLGEKKRERCQKLKRRPYLREIEDEEMDRVQPQDLHTVCFETIKYLEEPHHPILRQTPSSISTLLTDLEQLDLTKTERLQILNLAPTKLVDLVVCIEEFEERFPTPESHAHLISLVEAHLSPLPLPLPLPLATATPLLTSTRLPTTERGRRSGGEEEEREGEREEEEMQIQGEEDEEDDDDELVQEGLEGEGEGMGRELDEE